MAIVQYQGKNPFYLLKFTDGYIEESVGGDSNQQREKRLAESLYTFSRTRHSKIEQTVDCNPAHVWVLGDDNWVREPPEAFKDLLEGEENENYRVLIAGMGLTSPHYSDRPVLGVNLINGARIHGPKQGGMTKKRVHQTNRGYGKFARSLLERLHTFYKEDGNNPSSIFDELEIPYTFVGDEVHPSQLCKDIVYDRATEQFIEREDAAEPSKKSWPGHRPLH